MKIDLSPILCLAMCMSIVACDTDEIAKEDFSPDMNISISDVKSCPASHANVGITRDLTTLAHSVSGTIEIVDDCTLQVTNFNYDGGGPEVYFYAGKNSDFTSSEAFAISRKITGINFSADSFKLTLPDGKILDDFDSVSVWCVDFKQNFGDVKF